MDFTENNFMQVGKVEPSSGIRRYTLQKTVLYRLGGSLQV